MACAGHGCRGMSVWCVSACSDRDVSRMSLPALQEEMISEASDDGPTTGTSKGEVAPHRDQGATGA